VMKSASCRERQSSAANSQFGRDAKTMKRFVISAVAFVGLFLAVTLSSNLPVRGHDNDQDNEGRDSESRIQTGFAIAPVSLNLQGKNRALVGLGSYIVNAQGSCNDCHTCPSYFTGTNPFPRFFGAGAAGHGMINSANYLAGGVTFSAGPPGVPPTVVISKNITPDAQGKPAGLTFEQFKNAIRNGVDPDDNGTLAVMPWPILRNMTDRDLEAIYTYLSAIPHAEPGNCVAPGQ
jgi:hypothetical protein